MAYLRNKIEQRVVSSFHEQRGLESVTQLRESTYPVRTKKAKVAVFCKNCLQEYNTIVSEELCKIY